jgi:hypothetical protein
MPCTAHITEPLTALNHGPGLDRVISEALEG